MGFTVSSPPLSASHSQEHPKTTVAVIIHPASCVPLQRLELEARRATTSTVCKGVEDGLYLPAHMLQGQVKDISIKKAY